MTQGWPTLLFPALHKEMEHFSASKMFILISTVMTWARTKTLDPVGGHTTFSLCLYIYIVPGHLNWKCWLSQCSCFYSQQQNSDPTFEFLSKNQYIVKVLIKWLMLTVSPSFSPLYDISKHVKCRTRSILVRCWFTNVQTKPVPVSE